ncbi:hypothetical protein [Vibrio scophthalmi]|uniref:DUF1232 domain-containing protein n=1 Tax=Vibrio scophthalmi TaxID=45658 RepID=A0A1E3WRM0_9VIBR|nr:hypothetical protein [Vibrio scophthalmi]ODS12405.1 hypothetical protein VSF3289_02709 [Vibrio scophthalmi]
MQSISTSKLWKKLKQVKGTRDVTVKALVLFYLLKDGNTQLWVKSIVIVALAYLINPADPLGVDPLILVDDIVVLSSALTSVANSVKPKHRKKAEQKYLTL